MAVTRLSRTELAKPAHQSTQMLHLRCQNRVNLAGDWAGMCGVVKIVTKLSSLSRVQGGWNFDVSMTAVIRHKYRRKQTTHPEMSMIDFPKANRISSEIASVENKIDHDLARAFGNQSESKTDGWNLLQQVFNFHLVPSNAVEPFHANVVAEGKRSMIPTDLLDEQLDALAETLAEVSDPEYVARVCDVLWLRRKKPDAARMAVDAYVASGKRTEHPENWVTAMERYERAVRLARQIEPNGNLPKDVLAHLESRVIHYDGNDKLFFSFKALSLLAEFRFGNHVDLAAIAGRVAERSRKDGDFRRARSYFDVQAKHLKLAKMPDTAEAVRIEAARTLVEEAESREAKGDFLAAHAFWGDAVAAFRARPALRGEIEELKHRYSNAGEKLRGEMKEISSGEIDISEFVAESRAIVSDLPWEDAFFEFISLVPPIDPAELRETTEEETRRHPIHATIAASIYDASGRKVAVRPSIFTDDEDQYKKAMRGLMEQGANLRRHLAVHAHIAPALRQLIQDHEIDDDMVSNVLTDSALIPEDRRVWIVQAFTAGFNWDLPTALHFLIPQFENALRHLIEQNGISPVNIDGDGVEEVWGIDRLLNHPLVAEIFGRAFVFELQSLLVERMGPNLRNLFAHGALSPDGFRGETALYLWWVMLRLTASLTPGMEAFLERKRAANA
ncbi:MAG: DUF4209 domain-containing protein [Hyphomonas sp.]|nr:DUF4209 domain-containing protein [Hyphomonas sp.]